MAPDLTVELSVGERLDAAIDAFLGYAQEHRVGFLAIAHARGGEDPAIRAIVVENRAKRVDGMIDFAAALSGGPREELESPALAVALEGWLSFCEGAVSRWLERVDFDLDRDALRSLMRINLLATLASVAAVDARPPAARLARAADALRSGQLVA